MKFYYKRNEQVKLLQIVKKANTATTTAQGCCAIITRFWNGNYDAVFKEMGYDSPSDLRKYLLTHKFCPELYTIKGKKERIAIFREKKKEDRRPESLTIDAKGRKTYPYLKRGCKVFVRGRLSLKTYQDKHGNTQTAVNVNANEVTLCGLKGESQQQGTSATQAAQPQPSGDANDDLPF